VCALDDRWGHGARVTRPVERISHVERRSHRLLPAKALVAYVAAFVAILVIGVLSYRSLATRTEAAAAMTLSLQVEHQITRVSGDVIDAETGQRGYLLTGHEDYLQPFDKASAALPGDLRMLRQLTLDNAGHQVAMSSLEPLIQAKLDELAETIADKRLGDDAGAFAIVQTDRGKNYTDRIRELIASMDTNERALLATRRAERNAAATSSSYVVIGGVALLLALFVLIAVLSSRDYRALAAEAWTRRVQVALTERLRGDVSEESIGETTLRTLAASIGAHMGAVYTRNGAELRRIASHALPAGSDATAIVALGEGLTGEAAKSGQLVHVRQVPASHVITSATGPISQREVVVLPAIVDGQVEAVTELVFAHAVDAVEIAALQRASEAIGVAMRTARDRQQLQLLLEETQCQAEELQAQGEDLRSSNDELEQQSGALQVSNTRLEEQRGELERDISARKQVEQHLEQMESRYRGLLEAAPDAMVVVSEGGKIVLVNVQAERQFGYRRDELLGELVTRVIPHGFAERLIADGTRSAADALAQHIGTGIELSARRKDGTEFPIEIMLSPLEIDGETLVTAAIRDISVRTKAERHLAQMKGRYRGLLEAAPDAMVLTNSVGDIVLVNRQAERMFGYHRDELVGQKARILSPPDAVAKLVAATRRTADGEYAEQSQVATETDGRHKDGHSFPIDVTLSRLETVEGVLLAVAIRDVTTRKQVEDVRLVQTESRYRGLLEAAPDAMVVVNELGKIVLLNLRAEHQFGYRRDELLGQPVTNIIPRGFAERLIADGTRTAAEALAQDIGTGIELSALRKDGTEFPIELMLSPLESENEILVTAAIRDITIRNTAAHHLAEMEGRYRGLLEAAPDPMVLVNQASEIVLVNLQAENVFGYRREELVGQIAKCLFPPESVDRLIAYVVRAGDRSFGEQSRTPIEVDARKKDGGSFPVDIMLSRLETREGILLAIAVRDISARKQSEALVLQMMADLNRSNEELQQFAYIASHDLQEPLRMVASYTQLLAKRYSGKLDAEADEFIAFAVDGANRMQRLIQDLLVYSRAGTGMKELVQTSSELAFERAISNLRNAIEDSGAQVTHDPLPFVMANEGQLVQLFQNLVGNAIKYQNPGVPCVHVSSEGGGHKTWLFSVRDNGLGIDPKYFQKIFGMFQRLHKREEFSGTGIGLAICKKIVEQHGGRISVESTLGQGSTFRFALAETASA
jgi:PAS domain S-box-containing protein